MLIKPDDVTRVFDDACIKKLAKLAGLPSGGDLGRFGEAIHSSARVYIKRAAEPTPNKLHREIDAMHRAAERCQYEMLAKLIETITPEARQFIEKRRTRMPDARIPDPVELSDPALCEKAAEELRLLITFGATFKERKRPSGRPTVRLEPLLHAPEPSRAEPRRAAERELALWLQMDVDGAGATPAKTARSADAGRQIGPFARMVAEVLKLCGIKAGAEQRAVRAINDLQVTRRKMRTRPPRPD